MEGYNSQLILIISHQELQHSLYRHSLCLLVINNSLLLWNKIIREAN